MDRIDYHLLDLLQADGRVSWRELGETVGLSAPAVAERVRALESAGVITSYGARVDPEKLGLGIEAIIRISGRTRGTSVDDIAAEMCEVIECKRVTGTDSHVMRVLCRSTHHLEELLQAFWDIDASTVTNIVTSTPVAGRPAAVLRLCLVDGGVPS